MWWHSRSFLPVIITGFTGDIEDWISDYYLHRLHFAFALVPSFQPQPQLSSFNNSRIPSTNVVGHKISRVSVSHSLQHVLCSLLSYYVVCKCVTLHCYLLPRSFFVGRVFCFDNQHNVYLYVLYQWFYRLNIIVFVTGIEVATQQTRETHGRQ